MSSSGRRTEVSSAGVRSDLAGIQLLSGLDAETLWNLERRCRWYLLAANQMILQSGYHTKHDIYFVIEGTVRFVNYSPSGREIVFANAREGGYFGEHAALSDNTRSASVLAVTDCRLASVAPSVFQKLIFDNPGLALQVIARLADIVLRHEQRIMELSTLSAVQRVHVELLRLAKLEVDRSGHWVVSPIPTHSDIASRASTSRETVVRAINQLAVAGIIEREGKALHIRDHGLLSELPTGRGLQMVAAQ